jgi:hypothetical protein
MESIRYQVLLNLMQKNNNPEGGSLNFQQGVFIKFIREKH